MSVDTPGDLHWINAILSGIEVHCVEWDNVEKKVTEYKGKKYIKIMCPPGCVKTEEDVERKCGIRYFHKKYKE
jgi:hypothetical protein